MTLLFVSILPLCIFCAMAAPQLKIGNSGYEIISINDQSADDSIPLASKLATSASRFNGIGALNLEKATDVDDDEAPIFFPQQPKRHYDFPHSSLDQRSVIGSQPISIDVTKKRLSSPKPKVGAAKKMFARPSSLEKEARGVIPIFEKTGKKDSSLEDSDSQEESSHEKSVPKFTRAKIGEAKTIGKSAKSIGNASEKIDGERGKFEPENFELADLRDEYKIVSVPTFDLLDDRSLGFRDLTLKTQDKFVAPGFAEPGFTLVTHFPSARIHRQKTSLVSHKKPAMFSPIYPSGFEAPIEGSREKSAAVKEIRGKHFWVDRKTARSKKIVRPGPEDENRFLLGQEFNEILTGKESEKFYEGGRSGHKISPALALSKTSHETPESLNHQPPRFPSQQPLNKMTHFKVVSLPLIATFQNSLSTGDSPIFNSQERWEKTTPVGSIDFAKRHQRGNDLDREFLELNRILTGRHVEPASEIPTSSGAHESSKDLVIDIVRGEVAPDDSPDTQLADARREDAEGHETRDASQVVASAKSSCCRPTRPPAPAFYDFLARFTNILLGKTLQYEASAQARDDGQEFLDDVYAPVA